MHRHLRKAVLATAAITAGLLMTACQSGTEAGSADKSGTGGATAVAEKTPDSKNSKNSESSKNSENSESSEGSEGVNGSSNAPQQDTGSGSGETVVEGINKGKGVNGTWFGNVSYLAPGKYTVSDMKGVEQQFLLAEDTKIWGYGDICGDANTGEGGQGGTECTEAELETAAKKGFSAEVVISNGIATTIRDDH
ncbi:hypothetical protein EAO75_33865 [Streptomyces sp. uw30]|uniref:hypothetical protein n=1 Tax=Streptomyces sp. uw30 TaxID=1828179 RepID=UPI0011CD4EE2|nr:hypothetical protein [Streptomyces sp. uw30]TXS42172.1 hypothetical protein EAO75_33865 [Streptomyces sp. uw30]